MTKIINLESFNAMLRTEVYALERRYNETGQINDKHFKKLTHAILIWNTNNPNFIVSEIYVLAKVSGENTESAHKIFLRINSEHSYILSPHTYILSPIYECYTHKELTTGYKIIHTFEINRNVTL